MLKNYITIKEQEVVTIMHARRSLLFNNDSLWVKKNGDPNFDVTMGSFDGAEICELVGLYILNELSNKFVNGNIGLYRDDGLACFHNVNGPQADKYRNFLLKHSRTTSD